MSLTPQDIQIIILFPKILEIIIYLGLVLVLTKRMLSKPPEERYILNKVFIFSFLVWAFYMIFDSILYNLASIPFLGYSGDIIAENAITGYPIEYPEVLVSQILRDLAFICAYLMCGGYILSAIIIKKGEEGMRSALNALRPYLIVAAIIIAVLISNDQIMVYKVGNDVVVQERLDSIGGALSILIICVVMMSTGIIVLKTMNTLGKNDPKLKKRSKLIGIGILLMGLGAIYWIIFGVARENIEVLDHAISILLFIFIGHAIWTISPILIYVGLRSSKD